MDGYFFYEPRKDDHVPIPVGLARAVWLRAEYVPVYTAVAAPPTLERPIEKKQLAGHLRVSEQFVDEALAALGAAGFAFPGKYASAPSHQVIFVTDWYWWMCTRDGPAGAWEFVRRTAEATRKVILDATARPAEMLAWQGVQEEGSPS